MRETAISNPRKSSNQTHLPHSNAAQARPRRSHIEKGRELPAGLFAFEQEERTWRSTDADVLPSVREKSLGLDFRAYAYSRKSSSASVVVCVGVPIADGLKTTFRSFSYRILRF
jgi:hypothetical protein